jgi:putative ABC transport system permease protein
MMHSSTLLRRSLSYYWRTHAAVVLGVAAAVAVLGGALLVGDSVRASLRDLVLRRLGNTDYVVSAGGFVREALAAEAFQTAAPLIALEGQAVHQNSGRRAGGVQVYGVDERFWQFHGRAPQALDGREALLSESLVRELDSGAKDTILVRLEKASAVPAESLHGRKDDLALTLRVNQRGVLAAQDLGEFSPRPQQGGVKAIFVPLRMLQSELDQAGRVNTILVSEPPGGGGGERLEAALRERFAIEDLGVKLRPIEDCRCLLVESESIVLGGALAESASAAAQALGWRSSDVLTYLANAIRVGTREVPYSLVAAVEADAFPALAGGREAILLNDWAARDLGAKPGDPVTLDYYLWDPGGRLLTRSADFRLAAVTPIQGLAADRNLAPEYPGITESENVSDWDPPFPIDLRKVRRQDEDYWERYRTTPKAFVTLERGQELWQSRYGKLTSVRVFPPAGVEPGAALAQFRDRLRAALDPIQAGLLVLPVRAQGLQAAQGATDFGEYFVYFSFFLVVSALLLAALFFKLSIEQRLREVGTLRSVGYSIAKIRRLYLAEGLALAAAGTLLGLLGAVAYGALMMHGLRTWWLDAVGTRYLTLHVSPLSLVLGGAGGLVAAAACIGWTLRSLWRRTPRSLLSGSAAEEDAGPAAARSRRISTLGLAAGVAGLLLLAASVAGAISQAAGFFGAGMLLLTALLCLQWSWLARRGRGLISSVPVLGYRNAGYRPGRSVLSITLIASAIFILVAVNAFRHPEGEASLDPRSPSGGYPLMAESIVPLVYDLNSPQGRDELNLSGLPEGTSFARFRLKPGDDTSCLNLYQPRNPRILGAPESFLRAGRFSFQASPAANPWLLLESALPDGAVPAIADANSLQYVLHLKVGEDFVLERSGANPVRLRLVAALERSLLQGELLISEANFLRLFPDYEGYRVFLIDTPPAGAASVTEMLEDALSDYGFDVIATAARLAAFNRVENTYLSTFQALGGLGLLLGTIGLGAVLLRNVLERRRELALLRAVGYRPGNLAVMVAAENALLLFLGVASGAGCALLAIAPAFLSRSGAFPGTLLAILLLGVVVTGMAASLAAVAAVVRSPLLPVLRAE